MKKVTILSLLALSTFLAGCGDVVESLGMGRNPPDEFAVVDRPPLALPPDFNLRPPRPGAARPQDVNTTQQASTMLFGSNARSSGQLGHSAFMANASPADAFRSESEKSILNAAGVNRADPNIRDLVDREATEKVVTSQHLVDDLLWWKDTQPPATTVDAAAEAKRIQEAKEKGAPLTQGATPVIEKQKSGWLGL